MRWRHVIWCLSWLLWVTLQCTCTSTNSSMHLTTLQNNLVEMKHTEKIKREILRKLGLASPPTPQRQAREEDPHTLITVLHGPSQQWETTERPTVSLQDIVSFSESPENITDSNVIQFRLSGCTSGCRLVVKSAQMLVLVKTRRSRRSGRKSPRIRSPRSREHRGRQGRRRQESGALSQRSRRTTAKGRMSNSSTAHSQRSQHEATDQDSLIVLDTNLVTHRRSSNFSTSSSELHLTLPESGRSLPPNGKVQAQPTTASSSTEVEIPAFGSTAVAGSRLASSSSHDESPNKTSFQQQQWEEGRPLTTERVFVSATAKVASTTIAPVTTSSLNQRPGDAISKKKDKETKRRKRRKKRRRKDRRRKERRRGRRRSKGRLIQLVVSTVLPGGQLAETVAVVRSRIRGNRWLKVGLPETMLQRLVDSAQRTLLLHVHCKGCSRSTKAVLVNTRRNASSLSERQRSGDQTSGVKLNKRRPFLILHTYQEKVAERTRRSSGGRNSNNLCSNRRRRNKCCKQPVTINFADIGWNDWILSPERFDTAQCEGGCSSGSESLRYAGASNSTCVPVRKRPLRLVYMQTDGTLVNTHVPDIIVMRCGCRRLSREDMDAVEN